MFLNSIKNKIKIFFRNLKHAYKLINNKEIPKVNLLKFNKSIIVPKNYNKSFSLTELDSNFILSSNSSRVNKSRLKEFNNILKPKLMELGNEILDLEIKKSNYKFPELFYNIDLDPKQKEIVISFELKKTEHICEECYLKLFS